MSSEPKAGVRLVSPQQRQRLELDARRQQVRDYSKLCKNASRQILEAERRLAGYFSNTRNPVKLLWSRLCRPGKMGRERKAIEVSLKAIRTELGTSPSFDKTAFAVRQAIAGQRHHMIISGTGRTGTTFLMALLTTLGRNTGYHDYAALIDDNSNAGLEKDICAPDASYIIKNPHLCDTLGEIFESGNIVVDHAFVPMRDLGAAARSRERISTRAGMPDRKVDGGFWEAADVVAQEAVLARKLSRLMVTLAQHDVPLTLLAFPRLVEDAPYLYEKLAPLLGEISFSVFEEAFRQIAQPGLITRDL